MKHPSTRFECAGHLLENRESPAHVLLRGPQVGAELTPILSPAFRGCPQNTSQGITTHFSWAAFLHSTFLAKRGLQLPELSIAFQKH